MAHGDVVIDHPNRDKPESQATRGAVVLLLVVSAVVLTVISIGGWSTIQGAKPVQVAYIVIYVVLAYYIGRWRSGLLPVAAAFAIILLIFAAISAPGWFERDKDGFTDPLLDESILGLLTVIVIPLQVLVIAFAARGFSQQWSVEVERGAPGAPYASQPA